MNEQKFAGIVEKTRKDLGRTNVKVKEECSYRFAELFKKAIDQEY